MLMNGPRLHDRYYQIAINLLLAQNGLDMHDPQVKYNFIRLHQDLFNSVIPMVRLITSKNPKGNTIIEAVPAVKTKAMHHYKTCANKLLFLRASLNQVDGKMEISKRKAVSLCNKFIFACDSDQTLDMSVGCQSMINACAHNLLGYIPDVSQYCSVEFADDHANCDNELLYWLIAEPTRANSQKFMELCPKSIEKQNSCWEVIEGCAFDEGDVYMLHICIMIPNVCDPAADLLPTPQNAFEQKQMNNLAIAYLQSPAECVHLLKDKGISNHSTYYPNGHSNPCPNQLCKEFMRKCSFLLQSDIMTQSKHGPTCVVNILKCAEGDREAQVALRTSVSFNGYGPCYYINEGEVQAHYISKLQELREQEVRIENTIKHEKKLGLIQVNSTVNGGLPETQNSVVHPMTHLKQSRLVHQKAMPKKMRVTSKELCKAKIENMIKLPTRAIVTKAVLCILA